ncbi:MAG: SpoIID/LytB domain-containing protein [Planctomycetota bacterium]
MRKIFLTFLITLVLINYACEADSRASKSQNISYFEKETKIEKIPSRIKIILENSKEVTLNFTQDSLLILNTRDGYQKHFYVKKIRISSSNIYINDSIYIDNITSLHSNENDVDFTIEDSAYKGKLYVYFDKDFKVLLEMPLLEYIKGLINGEMPQTFEKDYILIQTILSYTYFLYKYLYNKKKGLEYTPLISELEQKFIYKKVDRMSGHIEKVYGYILTYNRTVFPPFYHSTCGGMTDSAYETFKDERWLNILPLKGGIKCNFCENSPHYRWKFKMDRVTVKKLFYPQCNNEISIVRKEITSWGNITKIELYCNDILQKIYNVFDFRTKTGRRRLKSYNFVVEKKGEDFVFSGRGFGHRVGLCQYGANEMLRLGYSYQEILNYYYPGSRLIKLEDVGDTLVFPQ